MAFVEDVKGRAIELSLWFIHIRFPYNLIPNTILCMDTVHRDKNNMKMGNSGVSL